MKLTPKQATLIQLTMELNVKAEEYKLLCKELENVKSQNIDPNSKTLLSLLAKFKINHEEITRINNELRKLN